MSGLVSRFSLAVAIFAASCSVLSGQEAQPANGSCNLLSPDDVTKAVGHAYDAPYLMGDPRTFTSPKGDTDCNYTPRSVGEPLMLRVFVDNSTEQAAKLFEALKPFHGTTTTVSGIGDDAYLDSLHHLYVRKGNVRYYLDLGEDTKADKAIRDLATVVAGRL